VMHETAERAESITAGAQMHATGNPFGADAVARSGAAHPGSAPA